MKTNVSLLSAILAASFIGVTVLTLASIIATATGIAVLASISLLGLAQHDYSRPVRRLSAAAPVLRPTLQQESPVPHAIARQAA